MRSLAELQRGLQRHIFRPGRAMQRAVLASARAGAARRLGVYVDGYRSRLVEALGVDYPGLRGVMGARAFEALLRDFVQAVPSRHRNLRWHGGELDRFMLRSPRWRRRAGLVELARFEWALGLAFDAADAPLAGADDVARLRAENWPRMRLRLHPSVRMLALRGNAPQRWQAASRGRTPPRAATRRQALVWLVWRRGHTPRYRPLARDEALALAAAAKGRSFASICAALPREAGAARAAQLLKGWLAEGLIRAIK